MSRGDLVVAEAGPVDLDALVALEERCFSGDRLTRRSLRYLVTRAKAIVLVARGRTALTGYAVVLHRSGSRCARLYSLAVDPDYRGVGIASALLAAAEQGASRVGCRVMRLEVRQDNAGAIYLYQSAGYRAFAEKVDYYEDGETALCMEKDLQPHSPEATS